MKKIHKILIVLIITIIGIFGFLNKDTLLHQEETQNEVVKIDTTDNDIYLTDNIIEYFEKFKKSINKLDIETFKPIKDKDFSFLEDNGYISLKFFNNFEAAELSIIGNIEVDYKKLREKKNFNFEAHHIIKKSFFNLVDSFELNTNCSKISSEESFLYVKKGISFVLRNNVEFINFNFIDDKTTFVWTELKSSKDYFLCNTNHLKTLENLDDFLKKISLVE